MTAQKRINKELTDFKRDAPNNLTAQPLDSDDLFRWRATVEGPVRTQNSQPAAPTAPGERMGCTIRRPVSSPWLSAACRDTHTYACAPARAHTHMHDRRVRRQGHRMSMAASI